ncbi:hypothetical protein [Prosthecobacter sp.]|uniref:hypothetical protein n=1 Tax=Prosthecobacter sp. TaxID=1965333 RepID=UPI003784F5E8
MSETKQIALIAQKVSAEIFKEFGWTQIGPEDHDWTCVSQEKHEVQTHPSDLVMWYEDPYEDVRMVFNFDLKSYAAGTLQKAKIRSAMTSLCKATDCANVSADWSSLYGSSSANYQVHGLLFVYNHDGLYTGDFDSMIQKMDSKDLPLSNKNKVHVFGPATVNYLSTIAIDLAILRARKTNDGQSAKSGFYFPDLVGLHPRAQNQKSASIEMLLSPWQIIRFASTTRGEPAQISYEYIVYYRGTGESVDEFKYLFDAFFRFQMLGDEESINIRMPFADLKAAATFQQAKEAYAADFYGLKEFQGRLSRIQIGPMSNIVKNFSTVELGMETYE